MSLISKFKTHFIDFTCSPFRYPWSKIKKDNSDIGRFHETIYSWQWKNKRKIMIIQAFLWPIKSVFVSIRILIKFGNKISKEKKICLWKQFSQMLYLANFCNIYPVLYYQWKLYENENFKNATKYVQDSEMLMLMDLLCSTIYKDGKNKLINDKSQFLNQCKLYGLPTPQVVAIFYKDGEEIWGDNHSKEIPARDLFLKFNESLRGVGAERWTYNSDTQTWKNNSQTCNRSEMIDYCKRKSLEKSAMLQCCLVNNKEILQFTGGALSTFRVVTYIKQDGKACVLNAGLKMPVGKAIVDNFSAGNIMAGVDLQTGELSSAISDLTIELFNNHPDTRAKIDGHQLICWEEIKNLSIKAQECFRRPLSIGWDIAMTTQGPVIIEGNTHYCYESAQVCLKKPYGDTPLPTVYLEALANYYAK